MEKVVDISGYPRGVPGDRGCLERCRRWSILLQRSSSAELAPARASQLGSAAVVAPAAVVFHWGMCARLDVFQKVRQEH